MSNDFETRYEHANFSTTDVVVLRFLSYPLEGNHYVRVAKYEAQMWITANADSYAYGRKWGRVIRSKKDARIRFNVSEQLGDMAAYLDQEGVTEWLLQRMISRNTLRDSIGTIHSARDLEILPVRPIEQMVIYQYTGVMIGR